MTRDPFRLMGFGHRVYKNYDPRATLMRGICQDVLASIDTSGTPELELAQVPQSPPRDRIRTRIRTRAHT